jgi:UPF0755 protein
MQSRNRISGVTHSATLLLFLIMIVLAGLIIWLAVPFFANRVFGTPSSQLSSVQKWGYSAQVLLHRKELSSASCSDGLPHAVTIDLGDSIYTITGKLAATGLIKDQNTFRNYLIYKGLDASIRAGTYTLSCTESPVTIAGGIENHYLKSVVFDILPGWRAEEIAAALATSGIEVTASDFLAVVKNPADLHLPDYIPQGQSVEGFLFPGEYTIDRKISARDLVQMFVTRFDQEMTRADLYKENTNGLNFYQMIILASIIQRETYVDNERPMIASVFYNRLDIGMKLETDPTVQYSLGYSAQFGWWKSPLDETDLSVQSDYNTYLISGLPPAPISNPDLSAIRAAENPDKSDYLYFRAKCDNSGAHAFAQTLQEQIANACK